MSIDGDLHHARDGQAIARIADEIASKRIRGLNRGGDCNLAALKLMVPKPVNRIGRDQLCNGGRRRGRKRRRVGVDVADGTGTGDGETASAGWQAARISTMRQKNFRMGAIVSSCDFGEGITQ